MIFLTNKQSSDLQTEFEWLQNTLRTNVPELPADFYLWPGKYALDCDAGKWVFNPTYDGTRELAAIRFGKIREFKNRGRTRVYQDFDAQDQRRLAFEAGTNTDRAACKALINSVRAIVISAVLDIDAAKTEAEVEAVTLNLPA